MATFQNSVTIARPTDEVFAFLADFQNVPRWNYAIEQTTKASPGPFGVGATYRQTRPFHATTGYRLQPAAGGTRLTNNVELEPATPLLRPIGPLVVPRVRAAVARNLAVLKELLEDQARQPGRTSPDS
jgi:polyketide cyclase/dehydrase/lipid transport protein